MEKVSVIGAGLAGCEAAWQLAKQGVKVCLYEMKPEKYSPAHTYPGLCELVCSNSLRSDRIENAVGLLKEELRQMGSLILECADATKVEAGGALAVDREKFSDLVSRKIEENENITLVRKELTDIPDGEVIIATGPLTAGGMADFISDLLGGGLLSFYDASAPIVTFESIDMDKAFFASRYDRGEADYINCPFNKEEYDAFVDELVKAEEAPVHGFEDSKVFEGCMPIEVMARRGHDTIAYGPLKPVGIVDPRTGREPYAVVQLRRENDAGTAYNLVGFQTHLRHPEQKRVFSMIPGLEKAEFLRYGNMHRNTFIKSPGVLGSEYQLLSQPRIHFAGQMTGVEGYVESAASGFVAGFNLARKVREKDAVDFTSKTAIGALSHYISTENTGDFQPMNINFGIIDPIEARIRKKRDRYAAVAQRALEIITQIKEAVKNED